MNVFKILPSFLFVIVLHCNLAATENPTQQIDDRQIKRDVEKTFNTDPILRKANIEIEVSVGRVTLSGIVDMNFMRDHAKRSAKSVEGVVKVHNWIRVRKPATPNQSIAK